MFSAPSVPIGSTCQILEHQQWLVGPAWVKNIVFWRFYGEGDKEDKELCGGAGWCLGSS